MDPKECIERIRQAYLNDDLDELDNASQDMLEWIKGDGFIPQLTEPQLSAFLQMAMGYSKSRSFMSRL